MVVSKEGRVGKRVHRTTPARLSAEFGVDACAWLVAVTSAEILRYEFAIPRIVVARLLVLIFAAIALQFVVGHLFHLYRGRYTYGTFAEVRAMSGAVMVVTVILTIPVVAYGTELSIPRSTMFIALPIALLVMFSARYLKRLLAERRSRPSERAEPTLVYGAGYVGTMLIRTMTTDPHSPFRPVGLIDDDPRKRNLYVSGIPVRGTLRSLTEIAEMTCATTLVVAIARADRKLLKHVSDSCRALGLQVKVMPPLGEILGGKPSLSDLRDIAIEDIIGRHQVDTEVASIAGYLSGKRVLVTGAGGSIGSELCRQIGKYAPAELIMLDRDETGLQAAQIGVSGHGLLNTRDVVLTDIRDVDSLRQIFTGRRPDVVFHAAALKHLPMLEQYPDEAWKTNVIGTLNVLEVAASVGVETFVNISTDKAADPTSVLGYSKRTAERLTAWMAAETGKPYLSVRFGNVIGSRGSMLPTFTALIEAGGPLTVTHPEATRYFMTIPEACQLVVQAGGIGSPGEVLILDMGEPVRILDVAKRMIEMSGRDIEIVYTGLREGEKLHEILVGEGEGDSRPHHPKISHTRVPELHPDMLDTFDWAAPLKSENPTAAGSDDGLVSL